MSVRRRPVARRLCNAVNAAWPATRSTVSRALRGEATWRRAVVEAFLKSLNLLDNVLTKSRGLQTTEDAPGFSGEGGRDGRLKCVMPDQSHWDVL